MGMDIHSAPSEPSPDANKAQDRLESRDVHGLPAHSVLMAQVLCALLVLLPILGYIIWKEGKATLQMQRQFALSIVHSLASHQLTLTTSTKSLLLSMTRAPIMHSGNPDAIHEYLLQVGNELPNYEAFLVFDPQGETIAGLRKGKPLRVSSEIVRKRAYFKEALERNDFSVNSALLLDTGNTVLPMTMPIRNAPNEKPFAYLMAAVSLSRQTLFMQNMANDDKITVAVFDGGYRPLFTSSGSARRSDAAVALLGQDIPSFLQENAFHYTETTYNSRQTFLLESPNGLRFTGAVAALNMPDEAPYVYIAVLMRLPSWQEFVEQRYLWLIAAMLLASLLGLYVSARVGKFFFTDGLERMATVAELTRKGDLSMRCGKMDGCREIQVTSMAFDHMLAVVERNTTELYQLSLMDPLTGLWNRRHFGEAALQELTFAARQQYPVTVVMADIDHFKLVNDTHGHGTGDQVLQHFAKVLRGNIRGSDLLARYGGEEFVLLLPNTDSAGAAVLLEKLRAMTESLVVPTSDGKEVRFTASFGAATGTPNATQPEILLETLQSKADAALYASKSSGRNRVTLI